MKKSLLLSVLILISSGLLAQQTAAGANQDANCTQKLRLARAIYEQGRLHELETLLAECLDLEKKPINQIGNFSTQERVDALRLLCLSYIYLEEPAKADAAMLALLNTDKFYVINPSDPAEFQALYRTFRTDPVFAWGIKAGGNLTMSHNIKNYYVWSGAAGNTTYKPGGGISVGGFIEKEFFQKLDKKHPLRRIVVRFEPLIQVKSNKYVNNSLDSYKIFPDKNITAVKSEAKFTNTWLDLNLILRYRLFPGAGWDPYIGLGPGGSFLISSKVKQAKLNRRKMETDQGNYSRTVASDSYSGPDIDLKPFKTFNSYGTTLTALYGVNKRFGSFYINAELRYQFGFNILVNSKYRSVPNLVDYGILFNDFRQSSIQALVGVTFPYFKPKKFTNKRKK